MRVFKRYIKYILNKRKLKEVEYKQLSAESIINVIININFMGPTTIEPHQQGKHQQLVTKGSPIK